MTHTPPPPPQDPHLEHWEPAPSPRRWPHVAAYTVLIAAVIVLLALVLADDEPTVLPKSSGTVPTESADDLVGSADVPTDVAPEPEPEPTPDDDLSVRGNTVAEVGTAFAIYDSWDDRHLADVTITDIEVTSEVQTEYGDAPENGHFVIITIEGATTQELAADDLWYINPRDFSLFTPDGERVNEPSTFASYSAVEGTEQLPDEHGPGESFSGKIALDSPTEHGVIATAGVEWEF